MEDRAIQISTGLDRIGRDLATHEGADYCYLSSPLDRGETANSQFVSSAYRISVREAIWMFGAGHVWNTVFVQGEE